MGRKGCYCSTINREEANNKFKDSQLTVFKRVGHNILRRQSNEITKIIKEL